MDTITCGSTSNNVEIVKMLLKEGVDKTAVSSNGSALLHLASYGGHIEVVNKLHETGADITVVIVCNNGQPALHWVSRYGHIGVINALLKKGADATVTYNSGWTPLHFASHNGCLEVAKVLLENGSDIVTVTSNVFTTLDLSCRDISKWLRCFSRSELLR